MRITRRTMDAAGELRALQDLPHRVWLHDPRLLNFHASFATLAWYRPDLDFIAVADDDALACSAICWFNPAYSFGEFEPVGTAPDHAGKGVGAALLTYALARLRAAGATNTVVGARADAGYPVPRRLYRSVGFTPIANQVVVRSPGPTG